MRSTLSWSGICVVALLGCTQTPHESGEACVTPQRVEAWPDDWTPLLGQRVTLDGWAAEFKEGSVLCRGKGLSERKIWIDGDRWLDSVFDGTGESRLLRVSGTVIKRDDVFVYMAKPGTRQPIGSNSENIIGLAGKAVYSQEEFDRLKWRFLLNDATWQIIE